jgi:putative NADPH-quinone reductase
MNILIINCHARMNSFCTALAKAYESGARENGNFVETLNLFDLNLDKYLRYGHEQKYVPEGDISKAQELIKWSHHMVYIYPTWWAGPPALLRLFFEMVFSPGFAFKFQDHSGKIARWDKLLSGKSARLISTMDAPPWYYKWIMGDPGGKIMRKGILEFCGVAPIKSTYFGSVKSSEKTKRDKWLQRTFNMGRFEKI